jgi:adenine-specific DNA-methyltransferase
LPLKKQFHPMQTITPPVQPITAQDPEAQSQDLQADNIAKLKALFPELLTEVVRGGKAEASINIDVLKALVGDATATDAEEKYGLNWHGKRRARHTAPVQSGQRGLGQHAKPDD